MVGQYQVNARVRAEQFQRLRTGRGLAHAEAQVLQHHNRAGQYQGSSSTTRTTPARAGAGCSGIASSAGGAAPVPADGSQSSAVVPWPTRLRSVSWPPDCAASPWIIDRPRPLPLPTPLVVKNGSAALFNVA